MRQALPIAIAAIALASLTACERASEPTPTPTSTTAPPPASNTPPPAANMPPMQPSLPIAPPGEIEQLRTPPEAGGILQVLGVAIPIPEGWHEVEPGNRMRLAELQIPGEPPTVITFTTAGGDVRANLDRWAAQFSGGSGPQFATRTVAGMTIHTAAVEGTYRNMAEPPQENFALRGAVIPTPLGQLFIKMAGPADQVARETAAFNQMVEMIRPQGG
jgi:hypothetical protein